MLLFHSPPFSRFSTSNVEYLHSLLIAAKKSSQLRSPISQLLFILRFKTTIRSRSFSAAAPSVWKSLPDDVKLTNTVVPALGDPRRERPPALYGHVINAQTDTFQR